MKNGGMVTITEQSQVIDSITYNGITVNAIYTYETYANNDSTYSCAAFIKKFYSEIYGISVYNLNTTSSIPFVYYSKGSFSITDTPQIGDIIRDNSRTHWAIVKEVNGNIITAIQQSYKTGSTAFINGTIDTTDLGYTFFTYSDRIEDTQVLDYSDTNQSLDGNLTNTPINTPINPSITPPINTPIDTSIETPTSTTSVTTNELSVRESLYPAVTVRKKTLYTGFKSYTLKFTELKSDTLLSFSSSNSSIAKINGKGKITPVSEGIAFITVKIMQEENTYQYLVTVTVKKPYIKLTNTAKKISIGETVQFSADIIGMEGTITWSTSDETIAKIDSKTGEIFGIKKGIIHIYASCNNGLVTAIKKVKII